MGNYYANGIVNTITIAATGYYDITAYGAQGGNAMHIDRLSLDRSYFSGGKGSEVSGIFYLNAGTVLNIVAGVKGSNGYAKPDTNSYVGGGGGGGGGSFVIETYNGSASYVKPLLVAGGGGGAGTDQSGYGATAVATGTAGGVSPDGGAAGSDGLPGLAGKPNTILETHQSGGGGGFAGGKGSGFAFDGSATDGKGAGYGYAGGAGSAGSATSTPTGYGNNSGGYGGGGGGGGYALDNSVLHVWFSQGAGGGGGGWGGGGGGTATDSSNGGGGGGGSFVSGTDAKAAAAVRTGNGEVIVKAVVDYTFFYTGAVQTMTITQSGLYDITAYGAQGGGAQAFGSGTNSGGLGAKIGGTFYFAAGTQLELVVGGKGFYGLTAAGGGGGGSFIIETNDGSGPLDKPLLIAGGGGGATAARAGYAGNVGAVGGTGGSNGGAGGNGGSGGAGGGYGGGGGGGFSGGAGGTYTNKFGSPGGGTGTGYAGGAGFFANDPNHYGRGGFGGGGGGGYRYGGGGGGGGYGGGGGGANGKSSGGGGGGGSLDTGSNPIRVAGFQSGNGLIHVDYLPCFVSGTRITTPRGDVPIEYLSVGDLVATWAEERPVYRPITWIGHRRVVTANPRLCPIRIRAGAFPDGMPRRDLLVSPDHAIFVDGKLICARQLANGTTIRHETGWNEVEYYHLGLEGHAIIYSEGLVTESYLDTGNSRFFANTAAPVQLHPDGCYEADYPTRETASCAPFVWDEADVRPVWEALAARAAALGQPVTKPHTTTEPALRLVALGRTIRPVTVADGVHRFVVPRGATEVGLVSRAAAPTDARPWLEDQRRLGVYVARIVVREAGGRDALDLPLDHPDLRQGWWAVEREGHALRRWTNGDARLPLPMRGGPVVLDVHLGDSGLAYLVDTEKRSAAA